MDQKISFTATVIVDTHKFQLVMQWQHRCAAMNATLALQSEVYEIRTVVEELLCFKSACVLRENQGHILKKTGNLFFLRIKSLISNLLIINTIQFFFFLDQYYSCLDSYTSSVHSEFKGWFLGLSIWVLSPTVHTAVALTA